MNFEDFAWDCIDSCFDCTIHKFMWCGLTNQYCKKSICPKIEEFKTELRIEELLSILKAPSYIVKKFQSEHGLLVDGIPGPRTKAEINRLILQERFKK